MKISDILLNFIFGYLPNIAAMLVVAYFFRLMFYYNINPYTYWFFTFCIAISSSISIYRHRNRPFKKLQVDTNYKKISLKNWMYILFFAGISVGGAYMIQTITKWHNCHIKTILLGMNFIVMGLGIQCFIEKARSLKLIGKFKLLIKTFIKF